MSDVPSRWARWLLPGVSQWFWLVVVILLLTEPWRVAMVSADGDACFHWRVGDYMLESGHIIRQEVFSHTRPGAPLISKEWLAEILFALAGKCGGLAGLSVLAALVIATTFALLHRQLVRDGSDLLTASLVTMLAMWAATTHWLARPHVFSFLLMFLWNAALLRFETRRGLRRLLGSLGVLMLIWVNTHGAYLAAFFVLGAYWWGALFDKDLIRLKHLTVAGVFCGLVALINPNGLSLHLHNLRFLRNDFFTNWLAEYATLNFQRPAAHGFLAWLTLVFLTLTLARPKLRSSGVVLLVMWGYFALFSGRNVPLLAILTAPVIAPAFSSLVRQRWGRLCDRLQASNQQTGGWPVVIAVAVAGIVLVPHPTALPKTDWPIDAADYIRENPERFTGNMFNQYKWGGYFLRYMPDHLVFVDGRADFYGEEPVRAFDDVTALRPGWQEILDKYQVAWTIMPTDHRLNVALGLSPGWERVYHDAVATIFVRKP